MSSSTSILYDAPDCYCYLTADSVDDALARVPVGIGIGRQHLHIRDPRSLEWRPVRALAASPAGAALARERQDP